MGVGTPKKKIVRRKNETETARAMVKKLAKTKLIRAVRLRDFLEEGIFDLVADGRRELAHVAVPRRGFVINCAWMFNVRTVFISSSGGPGAEAVKWDLCSLYQQNPEVLLNAIRCPSELLNYEEFSVSWIMELEAVLLHFT
ncbi:hypothetical protein WN943_009932 [Citrus x changshan-huyou]